MRNRLGPQGEALRRAVKWLSAERKQYPDKTHGRLVDEASLKFDLSPRDAGALARYTRDEDPQA